MPKKILVVDRNQAFATMLEQMLEVDGSYEVRVARNGSDALALLRRSDFDLTIVDMDLDAEDMGYRDLVSRVRQSEPTMRLMLIPLMGRDLPSEALKMDIQGTLSKPFFADDLLPNIQAALAQRVNSRHPQPVVLATISPPTQQSSEGGRGILSPPVHQPSSSVQGILSELAREINAEAVLLLNGSAGDARILAHAGTLPGPRLETLAELSLATVRAAQATAQFLGHADVPFEHNMFESDALKLYMMSLVDGRLLVVVTPGGSRLGSIRHNLRRAARGLTSSSQALTRS